MFKKAFFIVTCQLVVLVAFVALAAGSASESSSVSNYAGVARAGIEGGVCGAAGYTLVTFCANSECYSACRSKGYSDYCTGSDTQACFCK